MDQRHSPEDSPDARETPPHGLANGHITAPISAPGPAQDVGKAESEREEYTVPVEQKTYREPNYALPPMPPDEESQTPGDDGPQPAPTDGTPPRHRHVDKIVTPRNVAPVPQFSPLSAQPEPYPPPLHQLNQVQPAPYPTVPTTALPGNVSHPASTTYGGQAYPQAPAPTPPPSYPSDQPTVVNHQQAQESQPAYQAHPQQETYQYGHAEPYPAFKASPITEKIRTARGELPRWVWAIVGAAGMLAIVLAVWLFLLKPGPPNIVGTWKQGAALPIATSTGSLPLDAFNKVIERAKCGYSDSLTFAQDGTLSAESIFGTGGAKYQTIDSKNLKVTTSADDYLWTYNVSGDSLTIQGPRGCQEEHFVRVK